VRPAYRKIPGVDGGCNVQGPRARLYAPAMAVELDYAQSAIARASRNCLDLARKVSNQIAARNPGGQRQDLASRIRLGNRERDAKAVSRQIKRL
jgi:hypothetical protein